MILDGYFVDQEGSESPYKLWAPGDSAGQARPLVVFLHGDTGSNFDTAYGQPNPTFEQVRLEAKQKPSSSLNEMIFLSIRTPANNGAFDTWSTSLSNGRKYQNARYIISLFEREILTKYNVDRTKIYFVGQSGGGIFTAETLIPTIVAETDWYKGGGALMLCGAAVPRADLTFNPSLEFKSSFEVAFETTDGEQPNLVEKIAASKEAYSAIFGNAKVNLRTRGTGGHCLFNTQSQAKIIEEIIGGMVSP